MKKINFNLGLGLLESVVTISIVLTAVVLATSLIYQGLKLYRKSQQENETLTTLKKISKQMVSEIREMQTSQQGAYPLETAEEQTLAFYANIDQDDLIEKIRYFFENDTLKKGVIKPSGEPLTYNPEEEDIKTLLSDIDTDNSHFSYFDENYWTNEDPLPFPVDKNKVRLIKIKLTVLIPSTNSDFTITTAAQLRNLKENW